MDEKNKRSWDSEIFRHPLILEIGRLAAESAALRLIIIHPTSSGWGQICGDTRTDLQPAFCKLFQGTREGGKHCRMCHVLMAVAACGGGPALQRCHAGAGVMSCPVEGFSESIAVISSCLFADENAWKETQQRGKTLGVDIKKLRNAFRDLPKINERQRALLMSAMKAMSMAVRTIARSAEMESRLRRIEHAPGAETDVERFIEQTDWLQRAEERTVGTKGRRAPLLIRAIRELTRQRPDLPLTIKELAEAARVTPNHLTSLFGKWTGQSFADYLASQRIARAQKLLGNLTLNVGEVARMVGYDDPGYFARRFRQITGLSPREWRERGTRKRRRRRRK